MTLESIAHATVNFAGLAGSGIRVVPAKSETPTLSPAQPVVGDDLSSSGMAGAVEFGPIQQALAAVIADDARWADLRDAMGQLERSSEATRPPLKPAEISSAERGLQPARARDAPGWWRPDGLEVYRNAAGEAVVPEARARPGLFSLESST